MSESQGETPAQKMIGDFLPKMVSLTDDVLFGDVWERAELSKRDRSLITVEHRPRAVWYSDQVQTVRPSNTAMATISMRNDARFDTDQTSTASRR